VRHAIGVYGRTLNECAEEAVCKACPWQVFERATKYRTEDAGMAAKEIEIVVRGGKGSGAYRAAQAASRAPEAEGAPVDLRTLLAADELAPGALRGTHVTLRVETAGTAGGRVVPLPDARPRQNGARLNQATKLAIGTILLLMLFGAELRLNFGIRFDTFVTLAAIWVFWLFALRRKPAF
jgi:hypothetical protein